jgi:hypothetical protein
MPPVAHHKVRVRSCVGMLAALYHSQWERRFHRFETEAHARGYVGTERSSVINKISFARFLISSTAAAPAKVNFA